MIVCEYEVRHWEEEPVNLVHSFARGTRDTFKFNLIVKRRVCD